MASGSEQQQEGDVESDQVLARLDKVEVLLIDAGLGGGRVEEELDLLEETGLVVLVELGSEFLGEGASVYSRRHGKTF